MKSTDVTVREYECEGCGFKSINLLDVLKCEKRCITQKECSHEVLEYDCSYERRSSQMHCTRCGREGSREELRLEGIANKEGKVK